MQQPLCLPLAMERWRRRRVGVADSSSMGTCMHLHAFNIAREGKAVRCLCTWTEPWDAAVRGPAGGNQGLCSLPLPRIPFEGEGVKGEVDKVDPAASLAEAGRISVIEEW